MFWKIKLLIWKSTIIIQTSTVLRNNVKISGIPQSVSDNQREEKAVDILKEIDVDITTNEIEACYYLGKKKKNVIVWVINRKHC